MCGVAYPKMGSKWSFGVFIKKSRFKNGQNDIQVPKGSYQVSIRPNFLKIQAELTQIWLIEFSNFGSPQLPTYGRAPGLVESRAITCQKLKEIGVISGILQFTKQFLYNVYKALRRSLYYFQRIKRDILSFISYRAISSLIGQTYKLFSKRIICSLLWCKRQSVSFCILQFADQKLRSIYKS